MVFDIKSEWARLDWSLTCKITIYPCDDAGCKLQKHMRKEKNYKSLQLYKKAKMTSLCLTTEGQERWKYWKWVVIYIMNKSQRLGVGKVLKTFTGLY